MIVMQQHKGILSFLNAKRNINSSFIPEKFNEKNREEPFTCFGTFFSYLGESCFSLAFIKDVEVVAKRKLFSCERKERK